MAEKNFNIIRYGGLLLKPLEQVVYYNDKEIPFTNREFQILWLLLRYQGQVFSKRQIYNQVAEDEERDNYHTVEITISRIRKKLEAYSGKSDFIITIRGRGYKFRR